MKLSPNFKDYQYMLNLVSSRALFTSPWLLDNLKQISDISDINHLQIINISVPISKDKDF